MFQSIKNILFSTRLTAVLLLTFAGSIGWATIIENDFGDNLLLYPNPTHGDFSIDLAESYNSVTITMTTLNGKLVQSKTFNESQLLNLKIEEPAGVYLLLIESGDKTALIRLVKK